MTLWRWQDAVKMWGGSTIQENYSTHGFKYPFGIGWSWWHYTLQRQIQVVVVVNWNWHLTFLTQHDKLQFLLCFLCCIIWVWHSRCWLVRRSGCLISWCIRRDRLHVGTQSKSPFKCLPDLQSSYSRTLSCGSNRSSNQERSSPHEEDDEDPQPDR